METSVNHASILSEDDVNRQKVRLAELRKALTKLGINSIPANNHRLCLSFNDCASYRESGLTAPTLYVFAPCGQTVVRIDGSTYAARNGIKLSASATKTASILARSAR